MNTLLIGNLTIDQNIIGNKKNINPGGAVYFIAKTFENLDVNTTVISPYGLDLPKNYLAGIRILAEKAQSTKTLKFENIYYHGKRTQKVEYYDEYLNFTLPKTLQKDSDYDIVMIAPVINNISNQIIKRIKKLYPQNFFCLLPQGFFRKIGKNGEVTSVPNDFLDDVIRMFNFICLSELDIKDADTIAKKWSLSGPLVAVTKAERGSSIYKNGDRIDTSAYKVEDIIDPTGAGDVFAAGFSYFYYKTRDLNNSLNFAHAAAALSLRYKSFELQYGYQEILNLAKSQKRGENL